MGNDTASQGVSSSLNFSVMYKIVLTILLLGSGLSVAHDSSSTMAEQKKMVRDDYFKISDLFVERTHFYVAKKMLALRQELKDFHSFAVGGRMLGLLKNRIHKKIDDLAASRLPEAQEVLDSLCEYYKALFISNALRSAHAESFECGANALDALTAFGTLFIENSDANEDCYSGNVARQVDFIKLSMELLSHARSAWWRLRFSRNLVQKRIEKSLSKFDHLLLPCADSDYHDSSKCQRCCSFQVFHMINLGIIKHKTWRDPRDSYALENVLLAFCGLGISTIFLRKFI